MANLLRIAPLILALSAAAQGDPTAPGKPQSLTIDSGIHPIPKMVERVAAFLDYNILYNASEIESAGEIRLTRRTEVDAKGCWELFGTLLYHKGLAIVTIDEARGFHEIISMNGPRQREITNSALFVKLEDAETYAKLKATPILTTVPLKNINATIAVNSLRPFFATTGSSGSNALTIGTVGNNTDLLIQGFGPQVAAACRLLRLVDVRGDEPSDEVQVVRLIHANAGDIVATLDVAWSSRKAAQQMQAQMQGLPPSPPQLRVVAHNALNAVVLTGSSANIKEALELVAKLDAPAAASIPQSSDLLRLIGKLEARIAALEGQKADK